MTMFLNIIVLLTAGLCYGKPFDSKVIYNSDTRVEIDQESPPELMQFIKQRTLAITHNANLFYQPEGQVIIMPRHYGRAFKLCPDERFFDQPSLANCSAAVIGKDLLLTAGHCISENNCRYMRFISDFVMLDGGKNPVHTKLENIYACKKIIFENDDPKADIAIIQIDRKFAHTPLKLSEKTLSLNDEILAVGFPSGLPMKSSGLGPIRSVSGTMINAELETYGGNSGSPVFKKNSDAIEGVLVAGETDFEEDTVNKCYRSKICNSQSCSGEDIISAQFIRTIIPHQSDNN